MPNIYAKGAFELTVALPAPDFMEDWDSPEAARVCDEYGHPSFTLNFKIDDPADPRQPMLIFVPDNGAYAGGMQSEKIGDGLYKFAGEGAFKVSVHKDTVAAIKSGAQPMLYGVTKNRAAFDFFDPSGITIELNEWDFSVKKII